MNYFDYWEYDTIDFLKRFIEAELDCLSVKDFLKRFELEHYELSIDLKEAKRILLVYGNSEYSFSSTDLSWISDRTKVLVYSFEDRNLVFVDLDSSCDTYYLNSAAFIKIFNMAFPNNNCYVFKTCGGLAVGSMRSFNSNIDSNFCVTQLFVEESLPTAAEFFDELLFDKYEAIPSTIINYSPQERFEYVKPHKHDSEWDCFEEQISFDFPEDPIIYANYKEACDVLKNIVNEGDISSLDVLEEALLSEEKVLSAPIGFASSEGAPLAFEDEDDYSADAYADAEHKLDIQTAVEIGALVPVRCIRIHTNIDMTKVRFNSVQYNIRDLDDKIFVPERNKLIVDTWLSYVKNKRTVVFCASVKHAEQIAKLFQDAGIDALAVSGSTKTSERNEQLAKFASGNIKVLCACDLLNEGWDCPQTEVLFMARPTMSKVLYTQQLGRGMRNCKGKEHLMVFDFVDNASQYNAPYSMHRLFKLKNYHPGGTVLGKKGDREAEADLYAKGERPDAVIDYPVHAIDYELVDIFNWQEEVSDMYSQMELIRHLSVNTTHTIDNYIKRGDIEPDFIVPMSENKVFRYYKKQRVQEYSQRFGWTIIEDGNKVKLFMEMIKEMRMDHSYKPVLLKAILTHADSNGRTKISDLVEYFKNYYNTRRSNGLIVEKSDSIFVRENCTDKEIEREILSYPFKRFENMSMIHHTKTLGVIQIDPIVWKQLTDHDKEWIESVCNEKIDFYYQRINKNEKT